MKNLRKQIDAHESKSAHFYVLYRSVTLYKDYMEQWPAWVTRFCSVILSEVRMFALSNRPFRNAGLALYGLGSLASVGLVSNQANAQTVATNNQPAAAITRSEACAHLTKDYSPKGIETYVACELREIDRRINALNQRGAEAERRAACTSWFIEEIKSSPTRLEAGRALLGGKSIRDVDPCAVLIQLKKG